MAKGIYQGGRATTGFLPDPDYSRGSVQPTGKTPLEHESLKKLVKLNATPLPGFKRETVTSGSAAIAGTRVNGGARISGGSV